MVKQNIQSKMRIDNFLPNNRLQLTSQNLKDKAGHYTLSHATWGGYPVYKGIFVGK